MQETSKTPMTDAEIIKTLGMSVQHALKNMQDFAKKLELENLELRSTLKQLNANFVTVNRSLCEKLAEIEKMRNCDNCNHLGASLWEDDRDPCGSCIKLEKWEARKC